MKKKIYLSESEEKDVQLLPKKIALIGTTANSLFNFRQPLIHQLRKRGCQIYVLGTDFDAASKRRVQELGVIPIDYDIRRSGLNPVSDLISLYKLQRILSHIAPDVVFSYFSKPVIFGTLAAAAAGVPRRVGMLEGLGYAFTKTPEREGRKRSLIRIMQVALYRLSFYFADEIIFLNPDDEMDLLREYSIKTKKTLILGGIGVDLQKFSYEIPPEKMNFIFVGRLLHEKGVREFIEAARQVKQLHPHVIFTMVGGVDVENPGGISHALLGEAIRAGIVHHAGQVEDIRPELAKSSVFVLPSYREGVPCSTQEAMAMGRAVITSDVPGCRETVREGVNGFLVPPWEVEWLAKRMLFFIEHPDQVFSMGLASRAMAEELFDAEKQGEKLCASLFS